MMVLNGMTGPILDYFFMRLTGDLEVLLSFRLKKFSQQKTTRLYAVHTVHNLLAVLLPNVSKNPFTVLTFLLMLLNRL